MPLEKAIDSAGEHHNVQPRRRLTRSPHGMIAGVCAGLSDYFGVNLIFVRIVFVSLGLLQGIGVVLYLILAAVIPARSSAETEALDRAPNSSTGNPRKTLFAYIGGAVSICAGIVAFAKDAKNIYDDLSDIVGPKPSLSSVHIPEKLPPTPVHERSESVLGLQGSVRVSWLAGDVHHVAQISLRGTTGSASVRTYELGRWHEHRQEIEVRGTPQEVQLIGYEASVYYQPDIFHLYRKRDGTWTVDRVCDRTTYQCVTTVEAEVSIQQR
jgi:phage shock protein C